MPTSGTSFETVFYVMPAFMYWSLELVKAAFEVFDDVSSVLNAYGKAEEGIGDTQLISFLAGIVIVTDCGRVRDEGFDAAKAGADEAEFQGIHEFFGIVNCAFGFEGDDTSAAGHLGGGDVIMRMAFEERVIDALNPGVFFKVPGDGQGGFVLFGDPQGEGLHAAQQQVAAVRIDGSAHGFMQVADFVHKFRAAEDGACEDVVMAGEVFGAALQDQVDAELQRPLVEGRRKGAVDKGQDIVTFGDFFKLDKVEDVQIRIGRRFGEDEPGIFFDGLVEGVIVAERDESCIRWRTA